MNQSASTELNLKVDIAFAAANNPTTLRILTVSLNVKYAVEPV